MIFNNNNIIIIMYCSVLEVFLEAPAPTLYPTEGQRAEVHNTCIIYCDTHIRLALLSLSLDWVHWREGVARRGLHKTRKRCMCAVSLPY